MEEKMAIKLVVDSASDYVEEEARGLGIELVPMEVRFEEECFLDGFNLSHKEFFEKLIESSDLPKTSQINEYVFEECFDRLTRGGDEVIAITLSSKLSGTYSSAEKAAKKFGGKVRVVDSLSASIGERILCQYAYRMIGEGKGIDEICQKLEESKSNIKVLALLDTLKYLKKGGRISSVVALTGEVFSIKPVISIVNGEVKMAGKAVGSKKGNNLLNQLVESSNGIDFSLPFAVGFSGLSDHLLVKYLEDSGQLWKDKVENIPSYMIGSTIGTHVGPGAIAVAFFAQEK
ncbi:MAG: DegV family protein [Clostridia bacterium]|jgi:DegV family protein with EDD domain|nr:DegV family protein [Clostridia bacterium]